MTTPTNMNFTEFAAHLSVAKSWVTALNKADRLVLDAEGRVLVAESIARIQATKTAHGRGAEGTSAPGVSDASERKANAEAHIKELELAERLAELVPAEDVVIAASQAGSAIRSQIDNMPQQLAPRLAVVTDEAKILAILSDWRDACLHDIGAALAAIARAAKAGV